MARILVAEDEEAVRHFVARALVLCGHDVTAVEDGAEAVEALARDPFDLLVTDIVMPVMDGIALALKARHEQPDLPILMMSGYAEARRRAHNLDELIAEVLAKPFSLEQLREAVDRTLASSGGQPR